MLSERALPKPLHPHGGCDSGKFSPLKRVHFFSTVSAETGPLPYKSSAETGPLRFLQHHWKPASTKSFQPRPDILQEVKDSRNKYIQVVGASEPVEICAIFLRGGDPHTPVGGTLMGLDHSKASPPQEPRPVVSERKRKDLYEVGEATPVLSSLATRSRTLVRIRPAKPTPTVITAIRRLASFMVNE